jgi:hypothetical protein
MHRSMFTSPYTTPPATRPLAPPPVRAAQPDAPGAKRKLCFATPLHMDVEVCLPPPAQPAGIATSLATSLAQLALPDGNPPCAPPPTPATQHAPSFDRQLAFPAFQPPSFPAFQPAAPPSFPPPPMDLYVHAPPFAPAARAPPAAGSGGGGRNSSKSRSKQHRSRHYKRNNRLSEQIYLSI